MERLVVQTPQRVIGFQPAIDSGYLDRCVGRGVLPVWGLRIACRQRPNLSRLAALSGNHGFQRYRLGARRLLGQVGGHSAAGQNLDVLLHSVQEQEEGAGVVGSRVLLLAGRRHEERRRSRASRCTVQQPADAPAVLGLHEAAHGGGLFRAGRPLGRLGEDIEVARVVSFERGFQSEISQRVEVYYRPRHNRRSQHNADDDRRQQPPVGEAAPRHHRPRRQDSN